MSTLDAVQRVKAQGPDDTASSLRKEALAFVSESLKSSSGTDAGPKRFACSATAPAPEPVPEFSGKEAYAGFQLLYHHLWNDLAKSYYDKSKSAKLKSLEHAYDEKISTLSDLDLALKLMAESLDDRYTWYAGAAEIKKSIEESKTKKSAGFDLFKHGDHFEIDDIIYKGPAYKTIVHEGDTVECINDVALDALSNKEANSLLRGKSGEKIKVSAVSSETGQAYEAEIRLLDTPQASVSSNLIDGRFVHVHFPTFIEAGKVTDYSNLARFVEHVSMQLKSAGGNADGLVLDLRNNLGGDTEEAILFSSLFLKPGQNISLMEQANGSQMRKVVADSDLVFEGKKVDTGVLKFLRETPLIVLGNASTASSSELTIAALQDNKRAKFVGEQSFGKGVGFKVILSQTGGNLSVTNLHYKSPSGRDLNGKGLEPDIKVGRARDLGRDLQLDTAIMELKKAGETQNGKSG